MTHSERTHAKYSASAAHRWMRCAGSPRMIASVPARPSGPWAQDGTEAHELLEYALRNKIWSALEAFMSSGFVWEHRKDTEEERLASVQTAIDYVYELLDAYDDAMMILEHQFKFPSLVSDECGGTNDVIIIVPSLSLIYVIDFKHGAGVAVEVEENWQLMIYGLGAFDGLPDYTAEDNPITGVFDPTITLAIVQPRAFHPRGPIREWIVPGERLTEIVAEVDDAITACEQPNAPLTPGPEQCQWCDANTTCPALERKAMQAIATNFASVKQVAAASELPDPTQMPVDRLAEILSLQELVEGFFHRAYDHAYQLARSGYTIPGFKLVEAQSRRKWHGAQGELAAQLMALTNASVDDVYPRKLIGITEAEKMIVDAYKIAAPPGGQKRAATDAKKAMSVLTIKDTSGKLVLAPISDSRQAVSTGDNFTGVVALPPPDST